MIANIWFDPRYAGWVGAIAGMIIGIWGTVGGVAAGFLVPKGRGKSFMFGTLYTGAIVGFLLMCIGIAALVDQQPYAIWYPLLLPGVILILVSLPLVFVVKKRYTEVEMQKMHDSELLDQSFDNR